MTLHGFAESNHQLSMLMRNLNRSPIYDDASLVKVQQNNQHGNQVSAFNLQVAVGTTTFRNSNRKDIFQPRIRIICHCKIV